MLKQKLKFFCSGFLAASVLFSSISIFAAPIKQKIEVTFSGKKVSVNSKEVSLKDSKGKAIQPFDYNGITYMPMTKALTDALQLNTKFDSKKNIYNFTKPYITNDLKVYNDEKPIDLVDKDGNKVQPFLYNGNVYLPLDLAAKALGKNVQYDGKANRIYIGKRTATGTPDIWLSDMIIFDFKRSDNYSLRYKYEPVLWGENDVDNTGKSYSNGLVFYQYVPGYSRDQTHSQYTQFVLNNKYKKFKGTIVLLKNYYDTPLKSNVKIYGDENVLFTGEITSGVLPIDFDVDVSGVLKLKIEINTLDKWNNANGWNLNLGIVNAGLYEK